MTIKDTGMPIDRSEQADASNSKKSYEAPRVLYRESLEAVAAACIPTDPPPSNGKVDVPATCGTAGS